MSSTESESEERLDFLPTCSWRDLVKTVGAVGRDGTTNQSKASFQVFWLIYSPPSTSNSSNPVSGFSLTLEVEGHCLVSRQVTCKIEGRRPEPLGGSEDMLPWEIFKMQVSRKCIFLQSGKEILLWRILILIIVKKNDTVGKFVYFTIQLQLHQNTAFVLRASSFLTVTS